MRKEVRWPFHIVLTDEPLKIVDLYGDEIDLIDEGGAWDGKAVYIYAPAAKTGLQKFGIFVHEWLEQLLEVRFKMSHNKTHKIASVVEKVITFGNPA